MHVSFLPPNFHVVLILIYLCLHLCIPLLSLVLSVGFKPSKAELSFCLWSTQRKGHPAHF